MKRVAFAIAAGVLLGSVGTLGPPPAEAHSSASFYALSNQYDGWRPTWRERDTWLIDGGKGVGEHSGANRYYAVDLNKSGGPDTDCGAPLRADKSGIAQFYTESQTGGYGNLIGIRHRNGNSSWYAHLTANSPPPFSDLLQGDLSGYSDNTGASDGCHLHFQVHDNHNTPFSGAYNTIEICMSGGCPGAGFNLQHLTDERNTAHPSNNTGPGFGRPGAPTHLDPGSDTQPLSGPIHTLARGIFVFGGEPGSTFAAVQGACATNRHWVKGCNFGFFGGFGYSQNFHAPGFPVVVPYSMTEGPNGAQVVQRATWKAFGRQCQGQYVYNLIGKPVAAEGNIAWVYNQTFQFGSMQRDEADQNNTIVRVYDGPNLLCTLSGFVNYYTGPCYDVNGTGVVDTADISAVAARFGQIETNPSYDDRYDVNFNGVINTQDISLVTAQFGRVCN